MKYKLTFLFVAITFFLYGQNNNVQYKKLKVAFEKISYWSAYNHSRKDDDKINSSDSLEKYNDRMGKILVQMTSSNAESLTYDFKDLTAKGLGIVTSEDGLFRIYTWDTNAGGTMHYFRNVFQFKDKNKVMSKIEDFDLEEPNFNYYQINDIISEGKKFYITQSQATLDSWYTYNKVKVFSIEDSNLNEKAVLIKTKSGIRNELGYAVNRPSAPDPNMEEIPDFEIEYDKRNKTISIPIILEDGTVTGKRIKYQFKGKYFEKI